MRRSDPTTPSPGREVRKTVSVLFCDVAGSTSLGERSDPETVRRVMTRYFDRMRSVIAEHGGTVEKFIGDAVMAVFGVPQAHEDDALRAVRRLQDQAWLALAEALRAAGRNDDAVAAAGDALDRFERKGAIVLADRARTLLAEIGSPT